jgi:hypothetical protein
MAVVALMVLTGCATASPGGHRGYLVPDAPNSADEEELDEEEIASGEIASALDASPRTQVRRTDVEGDEPLGDWGEGGVGWPDGVGNGRPHTVPMSLDYFQGFLAHVGVPADALPVDGRSLSPEQALQLLPHLLSTEVTLGNFAQRRMAAHLLLEVAMGGRLVMREELHARMDRFHRLRVLRPDGYLVLVHTGEAKQKVGEVRVAEDGSLRAGRYEVGPFYAVEGGRLWPVDAGLEVPRGALPLGPYVPDDGVVLPALEGAGLALGDTVEGLYRLVFHPVETLEGLTRLPGAVRELVHNSPEYWEDFRRKPSGERVRTLSRLTTHVLLMVGSGGAGAGAGGAKAASWGVTLGHVAVPVFSLTGEGALALRLVAVPGRAVAVAGQSLHTTYVLHMATAGAVAVSGGTPPPGAWTPPVGGPGQWVPKNERMSDRSRRFQHKVTKAPAGWVYRVFRNGERADFDGRDPIHGTLLETKGQGYDKHFDAKLDARPYFKGADRLVNQARRQSRVANGVPIRWHVAEPRLVDILRRLFLKENIRGIDVVYTPP